MTDLQLVLTVIGSNLAINTLIFFALSHRLGDFNNRFSDTNNRIGDMDKSLRATIQSEVAGLREAILRMEEVLDARLKHVEEKIK